jgi:hypothetical protein
MKEIIGRIPIVGPLARRVYRKWKPFEGSENYWIERYESGGHSGDGSYSQLAEFKAEVINDFVRENNIGTVMEYGCGDGNQLKLAEYPLYTGFDISARAIEICRENFSGDDTKTFKMMEDYSGETAELTLSLDVIYHLIEDEVFAAYMNRLFDSSGRFVIVYASDTDENPEDQPVHVRHRNFTRWVRDKKPEWKMLRHIPNRYPYNGDTKTGSFADFFIFQSV